MTDTKYNGWTNYETWLAALWIGNDEGFESQADEIARECIRDAIDSEQDRYENVSYATRLAAAEYLFRDKDSKYPAGSMNCGESLQAMLTDYVDCVDENKLLTSASFIADMFNAAMSEVDWREIGKHYIEDNLDEVLEEIKEECEESDEGA